MAQKRTSEGFNPDMHHGLKNRSAQWPDASTRLPKGPSVNSGATRNEVAPADIPSGERTA
jgi:hypothetical protein